MTEENPIPIGDLGVDVRDEKVWVEDDRGPRESTYPTQVVTINGRILASDEEINDLIKQLQEIRDSDP